MEDNTTIALIDVHLTEIATLSDLISAKRLVAPKEEVNKWRIKRREHVRAVNNLLPHDQQVTDESILYLED